MDLLFLKKISTVVSGVHDNILLLRARRVIRRHKNGTLLNKRDSVILLRRRCFARVKHNQESAISSRRRRNEYSMLESRVLESMVATRLMINQLEKECEDARREYFNRAVKKRCGKLEQESHDEYALRMELAMKRTTRLSDHYSELFRLRRQLRAIASRERFESKVAVSSDIRAARLAAASVQLISCT